MNGQIIDLGILLANDENKADSTEKKSILGNISLLRPSFKTSHTPWVS